MHTALSEGAGCGAAVVSILCESCALLGPAEANPARAYGSFVLFLSPSPV